MSESKDKQWSGRASIREEEMVEAWAAIVKAEVIQAMGKFTPFASMHEGASVIREEYEELWDEVKVDNRKKSIEEAIQVAAMAIRYLVDQGSREHLVLLTNWGIAYEDTESGAARIMEIYPR